MSARSRAILGVAVMSTLLVLYFVFVGVRAVALVSSGSALAIAMGLALVVLPAIGIWALCRELSFGWRATALVDELEASGCLPEEDFEASPSGVPLRAQAEAAFPKYRGAAESEPESWQAWMRLGLIYDACGDRKRARAAIRQAIQVNRG